MLKQCVLTTWGGVNCVDQEAKDLFDKSGILSEGVNTYVLFLNPDGKMIHSIPSPKFPKPPGRNPMYMHDEVARGLSMMGLPAWEPKWAQSIEELQLPDVRGTGSPAGLRLFMRTQADGINNVVVEPSPLGDDLKKALSYPAQPRTVEAEALRSFLVQLYPAGIRSFEQQMSFKKAIGTLTLEPAGAGAKGRYAVLSGPFQLLREESESSVNGSIQMALTYGPNGPDVTSVRAVAEAIYNYRPHGKGPDTKVNLAAAIESRPE
jgi:hypothetical protein